MINVTRSLTTNSSVNHLGEKLTFLKTFLRHPSQVGAIAPSSPALVQTMMDSFVWPEIQSVAEYGPGTGVFTEGILKKLTQGANFFAIEQSPDMVSATLKRCPNVNIHCDSVTNVGKICQDASISQLDAIVSGLPWAAFPESLQDEIMNATTSILRPGGTFATFAYWQGLALPAGRRFSERLQASFSSVQRSKTVWNNLPPAFVYRCTL